MKYSKVIHIIGNCYEGRISRSEAMKLLGRSRMTVYRKLKRYGECGELSLIHRGYGKRSNRRIKDDIRERVISLKKDIYYDFNDVHFSEVLNEELGIKISRESIRKILREAGIPAKHSRRGRKYRRMRDRKEFFGELIQIDASIEYWFDGVNERQTLIAGIDDATGKVWAVFVERESLEGYFLLMRKIIDEDGIPFSIYTDRHSIFYTDREPTIEEEIKGVKPMTQFGRAMNEITVWMRKAHSPQAKGRIERSFRTFQDRLKAEMRLKGIRDIDEANKFLVGFLKRFNKRFNVKPRSEGNKFRELDKEADLEGILCVKEERVVRNDNTIRYGGEIIQIPAVEGKYTSYAKKVVEVRIHRNGILEIYYKGKRLCKTKSGIVKEYSEAVI